MKKKLSPAQMKIAKQAPPYDKITGADFAVLKRNGYSNKGRNGKKGK